jgi:hypothetical protein
MLYYIMFDGITSDNNLMLSNHDEYELMIFLIRFVRKEHNNNLDTRDSFR